MAATIQTIQKPTRARALDTSGNNNHGQIYSGRALEFDGVSDYLVVSTVDNTEIGMTTTSGNTSAQDNRTVAVWIKPTTSGTFASHQHILYAAAGGGADGYGLLLYGTGTITMEVDAGVGPSYRHQAQSVLTDHDFRSNDWRRIVAVFDAVNFEMTLYVNGEKLIDAGNSNGDWTGDVTPQGNIVIGAHATTDTYPYNGQMSDFQIWNGLFTADDALYDYNNPEQLALNRGGTSLTESNLKLWYPMQDGHRGQQSFILDGSPKELGSELVPTNLGFDSNTTGWTAVRSDISSDAGGQSGNCLTVLRVSGTDQGAYRSDIPSVVGKVYKLTAWVKSGTSGDEAFNFVLYDTSDDSTFAGTSSSTWTEYTVYHTAAQTTLGITLRKDTGTAGTMLFDTVSVKEVKRGNHATTVFYGDEMHTLATCTSTTNETDATTGWTNVGFATFASDTKGDEPTAQGTHSLHLISDGADDYCKLATAITLVAGRTYQIQTTYIVSASDAFEVKFSDSDHTGYVYGNATLNSTSWATSTTTFTATGTALYVRFYESVGDNVAEIHIGSFSVKEVGTATGWTEADQQLDIPQTALQSYNQLAWFSGQEGSDATLDSQIDTGANAWSFSFWLFNFDDGSAHEWIIGSTSGRNIDIKNSDRKLYYRDGDGVYNALSDAGIPEGEWVHIVITAIADTSMTAYINGAVQTTNTAMAYGGSDPDTQLIVDRFMEGYSAGDHEAVGSITEISYYNDVLTLAEVQDLYNDGKAKSALDADGSGNLVGYWRNNGLAEWEDLKGSNDANTNAVTETLLIPAGVDGSRDTQGFLMNRQRDTNSLNLTQGYTAVAQQRMYVDLVETMVYDKDEDRSWSFWIKRKSTASNTGTIIGGASASHQFIAVTDNDNSSAKIQIESDTNADNAYSAAGTIHEKGLDNWIHVVVVSDAAAISMYLDGVKKAITSSPIVDDVSLRYIGRGGTPGTDTDRTFDGQIDDLLIYDKVLSDGGVSDGDTAKGEIARIYNAGKRSHRNG